MPLELSFTNTPSNLLLGEVIWQPLPTRQIVQLFEQEFSNMLQLSINGQAQPMLFYQAFHEQDKTDTWLNQLKMRSFYEQFRPINGKYIFVDTPLIRKVGNTKYMGGVLLYNEAGTMYWIGYYVQPYLLYQQYAQGKDEPLPLNRYVVYTELLNYLLYACIPRLQQQHPSFAKLNH